MIKELHSDSLTDEEFEQRERAILRAIEDL